MSIYSVIFKCPLLVVTSCVGWLLLFATPATLGAANSVAYVGSPFGVGKVTVDVLRGEPLLPLSDERFTVTEFKGRALYPVLQQEPVRQFLRGLLNIDTPRKVTVYYLFQGQDPFDLSAFTPYEQGIRVKPINDPTQHRQLLLEWWEQYTNNFESLLKNRAYPPVAENFLISVLSRRLNLPIPSSAKLDEKSLLKKYALGELMVDELYRLQVDRAMLKEQTDEERQLVGLPETYPWPDAGANDVALENVEVEPMASVVPAECFYVRFSNFSDYLWFRDLNSKWQGDLGNMVLRRGIKQGAGDRIQQQLSLRESALAKVLGPQVISDVAIIGLDHYVQQGAAIGILFHAKSELLLSNDLTSKRREALEKFSDATEETVEIEGQQVSLISTPNGQVRSYYAKQDGYHLVATSKTLIARFLQAGKGKQPLAELPSFLQSRSEYPSDGNDTVYAFVSDAYWRNLCKPSNFVENMRRVTSARETMMLELSQHVAQCEGIAAATKDELAEAGIIPQQFGFRADGSELRTADEQLIDSSRGAKGYYVPVADMSVEQITGTEASAYERLTQKIRRSTGQLPPITAVVRRADAESSGQQVLTVEIDVQGDMRKMLGKAGTWLGQPAQEHLASVAGDVVAAEAVVQFPDLLGGSQVTEHHLFGGLRDYRSPLAVKRGTVAPGGAITELVRGYLGAWPKPGLLTWLTGSQQPQGPAPEQLGDQMWQAKQDDQLLISFKSDVIEEVLPNLVKQPAERPAQVWLRIADLTDTQIADTVTALGYTQTRETSAAGSRMMNSLANQLHIPRSECRAVAEHIVDGEFVCPLGGDYQLFEPDRGLEVWASTALPETNRFLLKEIPEDFQLPLLTWFRGMQGDLFVGEDSLKAYVEVTMTRDALP